MALKIHKHFFIPENQHPLISAITNLRKLLYISQQKHTRSAIFPTHSPLAVTSPMFSPLAQALQIGVRVDVDVTAATFCMDYKDMIMVNGHMNPPKWIEIRNFIYCLKGKQNSRQNVKPLLHWLHMLMVRRDVAQQQLLTQLQHPTP